MGNKKRRVHRRKNRGGEYLKEWRILKEFGLVNAKHGPLDVLVPDPTNEGAGQEQVFENNEAPDELVVENCSPPPDSQVQTFDDHQVTGRRIVDISHVINQFMELSDHAPQFGCTLKNLHLVKEIKKA